MRNIFAGDKPYAKARPGPLQPGDVGIEFMTALKLGRASDGGTIRWGASDPGVVILTPGEEVEIRVRITARRDE